MTSFLSEDYKVSDAVKEVLGAWAPGTDKLGYEITEEVRNLTYMKSGKRPLDSTILRYVRQYRGVFGIVRPTAQKQSSIYRKVQ